MKYRAIKRKFRVFIDKMQHFISKKRIGVAPPLENKARITSNYNNNIIKTFIYRALDSIKKAATTNKLSLKKTM